MFSAVLLTFSTSLFCFFNDTPPTHIYTLSLHDALPIWLQRALAAPATASGAAAAAAAGYADQAHLARDVGLRSEEHTSELQSLRHLVCRLLLEKKKKKH